LNDTRFFGVWSDVPLQRPDAAAAGDTDDVDGEGDVAMPGKAQLFGDKSRQDAADGLVEESRCDEADQCRNSEGDDQ